MSKDCPQAIWHKLLATALIGVSCLVVGGAFYIFARDRITLLLSCVVFAMCVASCAELWYIAGKKRYEVVAGICIGISTKPFRKLRTVRVVDSDGVESTLHIGRQQRIKIGTAYRFYFKHGGEGFTPSGDLLSSAFSQNRLLGYEETGNTSKGNATTHYDG